MKIINNYITQRFIQNLKGFYKCEDSLGIHKSANRTNLLNEVTLEECNKNCTCRNYTTKLLNQTEPVEEELKIVEPSMSDNNFEYDTDFINQSLPLFDFSPLRVLQSYRIVKLSNATKLTLVLK